MHWPKRCHGDDGVPECIGNAGEIGFGNVLLGVEHYRRENDDRHAQCEHEETQFTGARRQRLTCDSQDIATTRYATTLRQQTVPD